MRKTYLSTTFAHVRLLASVNAGVHCQSTALNELLATTRMVADVWADTAVDAFWKQVSLVISTSFAVCLTVSC
jgi:hypothetical protein